MHALCSLLAGRHVQPMPLASRSRDLHGSCLSQMNSTNPLPRSLTHPRRVQVRLPCGTPLRPVMALSTGTVTSGLLGTVSLTYQVGRLV